MSEEKKLFEVKEIIRGFLGPKNSKETLRKVEEISKAHPQEKKKREIFGRLEELFKHSGMNERKIKELVSEFHTELVQRLREWGDKKTYQTLKKTEGAKYALKLVDHIHQGIPLSLKGYEVKRTGTWTVWHRKSDDKTIRLNIPIEEKTAGMRPAAGGLAQRSIMSMYRFAVFRKTGSPGPILFEEFLEQLGEKRTSRKQKERTRKYMKAAAATYLEVVKESEKKEDKVYNEAPFFSSFGWYGDLENKARLYPNFNDDFARLARSEFGAAYVYFGDSRLKKISGLSDRDRKLQDRLKKHQGFKRQSVKMLNLLKNWAEFTDFEIERTPLDKIKEFINKNLGVAQRDGILEDCKIKDYRSQKKASYLNQVITLSYKEMPEPKFRLSDEDRKDLQYIVEDLYAAAKKEYAKIDFETLRREIVFCVLVGHMDCVQKAFDYVTRKYDETTPVDENGNYLNSIMMFWKVYRECKELKK